MPYGEILGQENSLAVLRRSLATGRTAHAYLFEGTDGCGKKKTALAFIEAVFCGRDEGCGSCPSCRKIAKLQHPDLHLVEPDGDFIKIDQVRQLQRELSLRPFEARSLSLSPLAISTEGGPGRLMSRPGPHFGSPAIPGRCSSYGPVTLRPPLARGVPLSVGLGMCSAVKVSFMSSYRQVASVALALFVIHLTKP